jgi:hypothetical protein
MPIEQTIHARLAADTTLDGLVDGRMFPAEPSINTPIPYLYFSVTSTDSQNFNSGPSSLTRYGFTVDMWAKTAPDLWPIMDRVRYVLHGWRGGNVQLCSETGTSTDQQEQGYHAQKTFVLWANLGNVVALADSTGTVTTGPDYVSLSACDNELVVNCDGLTFNGEAVGGGPWQPLDDDLTALSSVTVGGALVRYTVGGVPAITTALGISSITSGISGLNWQISINNVTGVRTYSLVIQTRTTALNAFLPAQAGNSGKALVSDGTNAAWGEVHTPTGTIATNQTSTASTLGNVVAKFPVYNQTGTLVGYTALFDSIT